MSATVTAIVAAAGKSQRMGSCKQLLDLGGKTVLARCIETLLAGGLDEIIVVVNPEGAAVSAEAQRFPVQIVVNEDPKGDMASSVLTGFRALATDVSGVLVALCDYPLLRPSTVANILVTHAVEQECIIMPIHAGRRGHPLLFPRSILAELKSPMTLRDLVRSNDDSLYCLDVDDEGILLDMDTPAEYQRLAALLPGRTAQMVNFV